MSAYCIRSPNSSSDQAKPSVEAAKVLAFASVRFTTSISLTPCPIRCSATSWIVSPAPTSVTLHNGRSEKIWCAKFTEVYATETGLRPIAVSVRTRFAIDNTLENACSSSVPQVSALRAMRIASLNCPRICGSPNTRESSPDATRIMCLAACRSLN